MQTGKVILIGAGPGDPELITLKAIRWLEKADIVLTDRLVNPEIIRQHAPDAICIPVGKEAYSGKSTPQTDINELLVKYASQGYLVVRLKGGDATIFSNIKEELETLSAHGIPFEIIPGISAAQGVAASISLPLTARGYAQGIRFLTFHKTSLLSDENLSDLGATTDTLIYYMAGQTCSQLANLLMAAGKPGSTPILLAEQATLPGERYRISTLATCGEDWMATDIKSPALLMIGPALALFDTFKNIPKQNICLQKHN